MLIKTQQCDLGDVVSLYDEVLADKKNLKYSNWERGVYPTEEFAADAIARGAMFFYEEDGVREGGVVLDSRQPDDYKKIDWLYFAQDNKILVVHTLFIRPQFTGRGAASRLLADVENYGRENGYEIIRFDTYHDNMPARRLYQKNGYREAGMTDIFVYGKARLLRCFEKTLTL